MTTIGVLALQGDFIEHEAMLRRLNTHVRHVRSAQDLSGLDGIVLPGGESTTFCRLMQDFNLYEPIGAVVHAGVPAWGTCAGMIVLARHAAGLEFPTLDAIDIEVDRNAYGRQLQSFEADLDVPALGGAPFHGIFIRAPAVTSTGPAVEVLATVRDEATGRASPVAVRQGAVLATSFHPELTADDRFHRYFLEMVGQAAGSTVSK